MARQSLIETRPASVDRQPSLSPNAAANPSRRTSIPPVEPRNEKKNTPPSTPCGGFGAVLSSLFGEGKTVKLSKDFHEKRKLGSKVASAKAIYSLTVGTGFIGMLISWPYALMYGWGSFIMAFFVGSIMVWLQALANAEMTAAFPFTGGQTTWGAAAFGSIGGTIMGQLDIVYWLLNIAAFTGDAGRQTARLFDFSPEAKYMPVIYALYLALVAVAMGLDVKWSYKYMIVMLAWDVMFYVTWFFTAVPSTNFSANIANGGLTATELLDPDTQSLLQSLTSVSLIGIIRALPYASWFYGGYEAAPLAAEEAVDIRRAIPKVTYGTVATLGAGALVSIVISTASAPGLVAISGSSQPNWDNMARAWRITDAADPKMRILPVLMIPVDILGLMGSFYACSRSVYANSRAGYLPTSLSLTSKSGAPHVATIFISVLAFLISVGYSYSGEDEVALALTVFLILVYEYCANLTKQIIYIRLHYIMPTLPRPYKAPFAVAGALLSAVLLAITVVSLIIFQTYGWLLLIIFGSHVAFACFLYVFYIKSRLVLSPEKEFLREQLNYMFYQDSSAPRNSEVRTSSKGGGGAEKKEQPIRSAAV